MNITPKIIKRTLKKTVKEISGKPQIFAEKGNYLLKKDVSILFMSSKDLKYELFDFFDFEKDAPTVSAFIQQRNKFHQLPLKPYFISLPNLFLIRDYTKVIVCLLLPVLICIHQQR